MALGQFNPNASYVPPSTTAAFSGQGIRVGGPLNLAADHDVPIAIHITVIQDPPPGQAGPPNIARNVEIVRTRANVWQGTVARSGFRSGGARGIAVAVVPINPLVANGLFAYETLTWCEHITLP
jgi:hypothetical protein